MQNILQIVTDFQGVARVADLVTCGHRPRTIDALVAKGVLIRPRRGWVALPDAEGDGLRAVRLGGVATCLSVLRPLGVWAAEDSRLHIQVRPHSHVPAHGPGIIAHRRHAVATSPSSAASDSIESALVHVTVCQPRLDAISSLDSALHLRLVTTVRLTALLEQLPGCYREYIAFLNGAAESGLESRVRLGVRAVGIGFRVQVQIPGVGRVDILIGQRFVIEVDGSAWHSGHTAFVADRRRDLALARLGYLVVRLSYAQVMHEWPATLEVIRGIVARGEHRWAWRHEAARRLTHAQRPPSP